jgi:nucleoside-diphosphate-sugar epimerase
MKIFITGATGYIGQRLTSRLLEEGHEVHALLRHRPDSLTYEHVRFHFFQGDIMDVDSIREAMDGCEAVFHVAALAKVWSKNPTEFYEVNVHGTINILEAAMTLGVPKVVFTSSAAIYGCSNGHPIRESDFRQQAFFTDYECSKFLAEEKIQEYVRKGLPVVIVHPSKVYGPGIWTESNAVSRIIKEYVEGQWHLIPGDGKMIANFSFIDDVVAGHMLALTKGIPGEKYILGGENLSFNEFFARLKQRSGKNFITFCVPYLLMQFYAWQEEVIARLMSTQPKITRRWVKKYNESLALSSQKAQRDLGYAITPFNDGLDKTLQWLSSKMNIYF